MRDELEARVVALEAKLQAVADKQEIHETLMRYCRGVDRADAELISSAFHPDAISDHGLIVFSGADIGETLAKLEHSVKTSTHFVGRWERRDATWKIAYRIVPGECNRVDPIAERIPNADKLHAGSHSREDP